MPRPIYVDVAYDPLETPDRALEVMGRGALSRKSKTLFKDGELAMLVGLVPQHVAHIEETLRKLHAHHNRVLAVLKDRNGNDVEAMVPEVLDAQAIRDRYPIIAKWEAFHQEQVEHYASIGGFSVNAAFRDDQAPKRERRDESSAGADQGQGRERWR
jgi:hypothetical protein